jgi:two-component system chemotaxis response regulator CheY
MRAMVVDDSSVMRRIHQKSLEGLGWSVALAEDGEDALAKLGGQDPCELLLTDLHMPKMDGMRLIEAVRKDPRYATMKIIMVTSDGVMEVVQEAMAKGANDLLIKPFTAEDFANRLKELFRA